MEIRAKIIDLSQEIYMGMPVYPGHVKTVIWTHASHDEVRRQLGTGFSYETRGILLCDHGPTHIDSVSHLSTDPDAPPVVRIPSGIVGREDITFPKAELRLLMSFWVAPC